MDAPRRSLRVRLTAGLSVAVAVVALSACSSDGGEAKEGKSTKAAVSEGQIPTNAADPDRAVAQPAAYDGVQYGDDLMVVRDKPIDKAMLAEITGVKVLGKKGVAAYHQFSYGQFSVDGKLLNIAAVDPGEYRRFTGQKSAEFQDQWDRIAGGEIAVMADLQQGLPIDDKGYLAVGKHSIHVGAYSPAQVDTVDAMVNTKWGEELGLAKGNALVINTGISSPQAVREQIEKTVGKETLSITALDIVAQAGIDTGTFQNVVPVGAFRDAVGTFRYRPIGGGRIAPDPAWVKAHIVTEQVPILGRVTCNKAMMPQLKAALIEVQNRGLAKHINPHEYAGCYYPRFIAGSNKLSNHSFGLALDFNVPGNQRGTVGEMNREVVSIFKYWGFGWGGDWSYTDPMHFELDRIVKPG